MSSVHKNSTNSYACNVTGTKEMLNTLNEQEQEQATMPCHCKHFFPFQCYIFTTGMFIKYFQSDFSILTPVNFIEQKRLQ